MSKIEMLLDEENELTFQVNIEGNRPSDASCRLRLDNTGVGLMFEANKSAEGEISVIIPPLTHVLKEGVYDMTLEVIVDDKYFQPLTVQGSFEKSVKVTAEAVVSRRKPMTQVTAKPIVEHSSNTPIKPATVSVRNSKSHRPRKDIEPKHIVENKKKETNIKKSFSDKEIKNLIAMLVKDKSKK